MGTGEIHAHNVTKIVLIRAIRYLVYVRKDVKKVSGEIIATTHAVTYVMASVWEPRVIVNSVNHKPCMDLFVTKNVALTVFLTSVNKRLASVRKAVPNTFSVVNANIAAV